MDQELIAYLDKRFDAASTRTEELHRETTRQIAALEAGMTQRFEHVEVRLDQLEVRLDQMEARLGKVEVRLDQMEARLGKVELRLDQMEARLGQLEGEVRQAHVLIEALRHELHVVAEGFIGLLEKVERFQAEATLVFDQVRGWIEPYYRNLDGRLRVLESGANRQTGDVFEAVRRILGKPAEAEAALRTMPRPG